MHWLKARPIILVLFFTIPLDGAFLHWHSSPITSGSAALMESTVSTTEAYEREADEIAEAGKAAGAAILATIDAAYYALGARKVRIVFDAMVQCLAAEKPSLECDLFTASAFEALPPSLSSAVERAEINSNAWRAYEVYVGDAIEDAAEQAADFANDLRREVAA